MSSVKNYFERLFESIDAHEIVSERELSMTVELPLSGWGRGKTLLQCLGYDKTSVISQYAIRIGTTIIKVDFLVGRNENRWFLDLKKPTEITKINKHIEQMQSYLRHEKMCLGVLLGGKWAYVLLNPEHFFISDICEAISDEEKIKMPDLDLSLFAVKKVDLTISDVSEITKLFNQLKNTSNDDHVKKLSRKLCEEYVVPRKKLAKISIRESQVSEVMEATLANPSDSLLLQIIAASPKMKALKVKPDEFRKLWVEVINFEPS